MKKRSDRTSQALTLDPDSADANLELGQSLARLKRFAEAAKYYRHAIDLDPKTAEMILELAELVERDGRIQQAVDLYQDHLKSHPEAIAVRERAGFLMLELERFAEAIRLFEEAVKQTPRRPTRRRWRKRTRRTNSPTRRWRPGTLRPSSTPRGPNCECGTRTLWFARSAIRMRRTSSWPHSSRMPIWPVPGTGWRSLPTSSTILKEPCGSRRIPQTRRGEARHPLFAGDRRGQLGDAQGRTGQL